MTKRKIPGSAKRLIGGADAPKICNSGERNHNHGPYQNQGGSDKGMQGYTNKGKDSPDLR